MKKPVISSVSNGGRPVTPPPWRVEINFAPPWLPHELREQLIVFRKGRDAYTRPAKGGLQDYAPPMSVEKITASGEEVWAGLERLFRQAMFRGNGTAAETLARILLRAVDRLCLLAEKQTALLAPLAGWCLGFPMLYGPSRRMLNDNKALWVKLGVGRNVGTEKSPKRGSLQCACSVVLHQMDFERRRFIAQYLDERERAEVLAHCEELEQRLAVLRSLYQNQKPAAKANVRMWADLGWDFLCRQTNGHPEQMPFLAKKWQALQTKRDKVFDVYFHKRHPNKSTVKTCTGYRKVQKQTQRTIDAKLRDRLKTAFTKSFLALFGLTR